MFLYKSGISVAVVTAAIVTSGSLFANPLLSYTTLEIDSGTNPDISGQCNAGSCFGMEVSPNFWIWTMLEPGNDGGFITDTNQISGGQELAPSDTNTTSGDITAAWFFFSAYGTFYADNRLNSFSDTSNDGTTLLADMNVAWNGNAVPMGNGVMNDYSFTSDGSGGGVYSLDYSVLVPSGPFIGVTFRMLLTGNVIPGVIIDPIPVANDLSIVSDGTTTTWIPDVSIISGYTANCYINMPPAHGSATVASDCSTGSYTPEPGYIGTDSFIYEACAFGCDTGTVTVEMPIIDDFCYDSIPISQITTEGGGQNSIVNNTLTTTFTGHITTTQGLTSGGKNKLRLCLFTTADYSATSTAGAVTCLINGSLAESSGTITANDKLICSNKPDGGDTDRFSVVIGN